AGCAGQAGLEPATAGFGDRCASQLRHCPVIDGAPPAPALARAALADHPVREGRLDGAGTRGLSGPEGVPGSGGEPAQPASAGRPRRERLASTNAPAAPAAVAAVAAAATYAALRSREGRPVRA